MVRLLTILVLAVAITACGPQSRPSTPTALVYHLRIKTDGMPKTLALGQPVRLTVAIDNVGPSMTHLIIDYAIAWFHVRAVTSDCGYGLSPAHLDQRLLPGLVSMWDFGPLSHGQTCRPSVILVPDATNSGAKANFDLGISFEARCLTDQEKCPSSAQLGYWEWDGNIR